MLYRLVFGYLLLLMIWGTSGLSQMCLDIDETIQNVAMDAVTADDVILVTSLPLRAECVVTCYNRAECRSLFYNQDLNSCSLHSLPVSDLSLVSKTGWVAFDLPGNLRQMSNDSFTTKPTSTSAPSLATSSGSSLVAPSSGSSLEVSLLNSSLGATSFSLSPSSTTITSIVSTAMSSEPIFATTSHHVTSTVDVTSTVAVASTSPNPDMTSHHVTSTIDVTSTVVVASTAPNPNMTSHHVTSTTDVTSTVVVASTAPSPDMTSPSSSDVTVVSLSSPAPSTLSPTSSADATSSLSTPTSSSTPISLWLDTVVDYSTQYKNNDWAATQILGSYNVYPEYGTFGQAWAPAYVDQEEFIQVTIATPLYISQIDVYETNNAGGVKHIQVLDPQANWVTLFEVEDVVVITTSRIFSPSFTPTSFKTNMIKITTDCGPANDWVELDAVRVTGIP